MASVVEGWSTFLLLEGGDSLFFGKGVTNEAGVLGEACICIAGIGGEGEEKNRSWRSLFSTMEIRFLRGS